MTFRLARRTLLRSPWYTTTAVGTIALTVAFGATVFAVVDGVLFKPLPYPASDRLFSLVGSAGLGRGGTASLAPRDVQYLAEADPRIRVTGIAGASTLIHPDGPALTIWSAAIDRSFFDVLGRYPLCSRLWFRQP